MRAAEQARRIDLEREQEQRINRMNMSVFANISHDFRTPLTMISGPVSRMSKDGNLPSRYREELLIVRWNVGMMLRLVNQLMDFNRLENDALKLEVSMKDVIALHHGWIKAENNTDGGVKFTALLPAEDVYSANEHSNPETAVPSFEDLVPDEIPELQAERQGKTILVVDDDTAVVSYLRHLLGRTYNVLTVFSRNFKQHFGITPSIRKAEDKSRNGDNLKILYISGTDNLECNMEDDKKTNITENDLVLYYVLQSPDVSHKILYLCE
ncbi:MAG: sensor histidine kinase [Candidatus Cryptobacteroides sp.]